MMISPTAVSVYLPKVFCPEDTADTSIQKVCLIDRLLHIPQEYKGL